MINLICLNIQQCLLLHRIYIYCSNIEDTVFFYLKIDSETTVDFEGDSLLLKPNFHFCITFNPTYQGRQPIPSTIKNIFRTVALVKLDL